MRQPGKRQARALAPFPTFPPLLYLFAESLLAMPIISLILYNGADLLAELARLPHTALQFVKPLFYRLFPVLRWNSYLYLPIPERQ